MVRAESLLNVRGDITAEIAEARFANRSGYFADPDYLNDNARDGRLARCGAFELLDHYRGAISGAGYIFTEDAVIHEMSFRAAEILRSVAFCSPSLMDKLIDSHLPKDGFRNVLVHFTKSAMPPEQLADILVSPLLEYHEVSVSKGAVQCFIPVIADEHRGRFESIISDIVDSLAKGEDGVRDGAAA